jgi:hypothetical protein
VEGLREWCEANQFDKDTIRPVLKFLVDKKIIQDKHGRYWSDRLFNESIKFAKRVRNKELISMLEETQAYLYRP